MSNNKDAVIISAARTATGKFQGSLKPFSANEKLKSMEDFKEQCRRQLERSVEERIKYGFFRQYKPILDDVPFRAFETMAEYRAWADAELPRYLGFKIVSNNNERR